MLLLILILLLILMIFLINGPIFLLIEFIIWLFIIFLLWDRYLKHQRKKAKPNNKKLPDFFKGFILPFLFILPIIIGLISFEAVMIPVSYVKSELNRGELEVIVQDITANCNTTEEKVKNLLEWFERDGGNIRNIWGSPKFPPFYFLGYDLDDWIICVRSDVKPPLWVLTSRCGACDEHSILFREMAVEADIPVRLVKCKGIDHIWAEVQIDSNWVIVEPANVVREKNKTGYNLEPSSYEKTHAKRTKNISYIYAESQNGTIEDITRRYTNLSYLRIKTVDENNIPVSNVEISVKSFNRFSNGADTGKVVYINNSGEYLLEIGGGDIELISQQGVIFPLYNQIRLYLEDDEISSIQIQLKRDITKGYTLYLISIVIIAISLITFRKRISQLIKRN